MPDNNSLGNSLGYLELQGNRHILDSGAILEGGLRILQRELRILSAEGLLEGTLKRSSIVELAEPGRNTQNEVDEERCRPDSLPRGSC